MHPDLSPHLHTEECNILILQLKQCHIENKYKKYMGACNNLKRAMDACLKNELERNRRLNNAKALEKRQETWDRIRSRQASAATKPS